VTPEIAPFSPLMTLVGLAILLAVRVVYGEARLGGGDFVHLVMRVIGWVLVAMGLLALLEIVLSIIFGILFWIVLMIGLGTMIARYRQSERDALLWILAVAAERQMPLVPAVEAFAYEWGGPFGRRSLRLAGALRSGVQLPDALDRIRGLAPEPGRVAARVGTEAGCLGPALREAAAGRTAAEPVWQGMVSKIYYLAVVLFIAQLVTVFMALQIAPAMKQILYEFGVEIPWFSQLALDMIENTGLVEWLILGLIVQAVVMGYLLLHSLGWLPWNVPFLDRITKAFDTALTLRSLAWLVERGKPLHTAVAVTARSYPKYWFRRRLGRAVWDMSNGMEWHAALRRRRIISTAEAQLLAAAERVGHLPWTLRMAAESCQRRLVYRLQAVVQLLYPLVIVAISAVVAVYIIGFFLPMVLILYKML
jgi:protein transport protein HofC